MDKFEREKERELYTAKIDFFTNVAHEIRTPLTLIKSPLENVLASRSVSDDIRDDLETMELNTNRLLDLVNQLLDFRKTETQGFQLNFVECDVSELLQKTYKRFKPLARERGLALSIKTPESLYASVDREGLTKIISNLLSNALKYAKSTIRITTIEKDSEIVVTVTDDGIGITDQEKTKIFDAFYQVKNNSEINKLGIGIGLHMTRSLVQLMNGKIEVSDREDGENGVSISVYFPKQAAITALPQVAKRVEDTIIQENSIEENELESTLPSEPLKNNMPLWLWTTTRRFWISFPKFCPRNILSYRLRVERKRCKSLKRITLTSSSVM